MNRGSRGPESHNPKMKEFMARSIFLQPSLKRKRRRARPLAFAASLLLVLVFLGVFALLNSMTAAADGSAAITIKSLGDFSQARALYPDVFVPHKIPGRYSFESLTVTKTPEGNCCAEYLYSEKDGSLITIRQETCKEESSKEKLVVKEDHAVLVKDGTVIEITGRLEKNEMMDVFAFHPEQQ